MSTASSAACSPTPTRVSTRRSSSASGPRSRRSGTGGSSAASHCATSKPLRTSPIRRIGDRVPIRRIGDRVPIRRIASQKSADNRPRMSVGTLVLLRHGESEWNAKNLFTGWVDVDLSAKGRDEATRGGELLREAGLLPDVVHTSVLRRAINTANLALDVCYRHWVPVKRHWRLNERHYGDLQGKDKAQVREQYGEEQFMIWRRAYDTPPPPLADDNEWSQAGDARYAALAPEITPRTECLKDVVERLLPYWYDAVVPDLRDGKTVLVAAHGNSLRAVVKHLDGMTAEQVVELNLPTGEPLVYDLDDALQPPSAVGPGGVRGRYLDPERAVAAAEGVARQAG